MDVLIKDLPTSVHAELTRRAAAAHRSLRAYLREVLTEHVAAPSMEQWLEQVDALGSTPAGHTGAELVAEGRAEDDGLTTD